MFSVIFEVRPRPDQWDNYLGNAKLLRPELEQIDGFVSNVRYGSASRPGWLLSLSEWRDEKALIRWRTAQTHHLMQERGRSDILQDYHLRVGQVTQDSHVPMGETIQEQRLDETEVGEGTTIMVMSASWRENSPKPTDASNIASFFGMRPQTDGCVAWDGLEAILTPGDFILLTTWRTKDLAKSFVDTLSLPPDRRLRQIRVIRDYSMFDRREAPQYYPEVKRPR